MPNIAIIGASPERHKFGNKAVRVFQAKGYEVYPVHPTAETIEGLKTYKSILDIPEDEFDMVSFYLPPPVGMKVIEQVAKKKVKEVWFNPGAESDELIEKAESLGLTVISACSIVSVGASPSDF